MRFSGRQKSIIFNENLLSTENKIAMKTKFMRLLLIGVPLALGLHSETQAQLKDCNAFVKGRYVEVGVNFDGSYGSSVPPPAGYHPNVFNKSKNTGPSCFADTTRSMLGFVSDPAKDGWTVSAPGMPNYMGDYFAPGAPYESWGILSDGLSGKHVCYDPGTYVDGTNVRYRTAGSRVGSEWEGIFDSLLITQRTILDTSNTYFVLRVKIKNLAKRKRGNIYYMRNLDPDNDVQWSGGGFPTDNKIDHQNPNSSNIAMVSATGLGFTAALDYCAMASKDARAKAFINDKWPLRERIDSIYNESVRPLGYHYDSLTMIPNQDIAIGLAFKIDSLPAYDSTFLLIAYMFRGDDFGTAPDDDGLFPDEKKPSAISDVSVRDHAPIEVGPNPFNNELSISGLQEGDKVCVYDLQGKQIDNIPNLGTQLWDTKSIAPGTYILRIYDKEGSVLRRQLIQKQ
jgi:hypothetical protein